MGLVRIFRGAEKAYFEGLPSTKHRVVFFFLKNSYAVYATLVLCGLNRNFISLNNISISYRSFGIVAFGIIFKETQEENDKS